MSYTKTTWVTGDIVTAQKLNHIEDGIYNNDEAISEMLPDDPNNDGLYRLINTVSSGTATKSWSDSDPNLAEPYDSTKTYAVGEHCTYKGQYKVCIVPITTAEAWTASHWADAEVGEELSDLKSAFNVVVDSTYNYEIKTKTSPGVTEIAGYVYSDGSIKSGSGYYTVIYPISEACYVYPHIQTSFQRMGIYSSSSLSTSTLVEYVSSNNLPTAENPYFVEANLYVALSYRPNSDDKYCSLYEGQIINTFKDSLQLTSAMEDQITEKIDNIPPQYDFDWINPIIGVSHMGYHAVAPENTLPAFRLSKSKGFYFAECDIQFTSDNVPILMHDSTINRTCCNAADGSEVSGTVSVADKTYLELQAYDACTPAKWDTYKGTKIPRLSDLLNLCKSIGLYLVIDCKGLNDGTKIEIIVDLLKEYKMLKSVIFAFNNISSVITAAGINSEIFVADYENELADSYITQLSALLNGYRRVGFFAYTTPTNKVTSCRDAGLDVGFLTTDQNTSAEEQAVIAVNDKRVKFITSNLVNATQYLYDTNIGDPTSGLLT